MSSPELLVLTCASGKQCSQLIPLLYDKPEYRLRLAAHSEKSVTRLRHQYPKAEVIQASLLDVSACSKAVEGASVVYHINPSMHPRETDIGKNMVDAAEAEAQKPGSCFAHFIFSSVLNSQLSKMLNHGRKSPVEEHLMESSLHWTILQPSHFMEQTMSRLVGQMDSMTITYPAMYPASIGFSFVSVRDLAEVGVKVIQERSRHFFAQYPLAGTGPVPYTDYLEAAGKVLGKKIQIKPIPEPDNVDMLCQGLYGSKIPSQDFRDAPERMLLWYSKRGLVGNPNILEWLLGRPPTSISQLAKMEMEAARKG
ncbi:MAG: hypothetical protein Q9227_002117 [Pyrenula ochraceoflavens]